MKKLIMLGCMVLLSTHAFASGLSKNSASMKALNSAWNSHISARVNKNDITMGYGGEDVSGRPSLIALNTAA